MLQGEDSKDTGRSQGELLCRGRPGSEVLWVRVPGARQRRAQGVFWGEQGAMGRGEALWGRTKVSMGWGWREGTALLKGRVNCKGDQQSWRDSLGP